jgi:hypothetical protein
VAGSFLDIGLSNTGTGLLAVSGSAALAGTIDVACVGSCTFSKGTQIEVLSTGSGISGDFTNIVASGFTGTNDFTTLQQGGNEYLVLANNVTAAVPEPDTYALLLAGCGVMFLVARRRSKNASALAVSA